jgi:hypothetical protein
MMISDLDPDFQGHIAENVDKCSPLPLVQSMVFSDAVDDQ